MERRRERRDWYRDRRRDGRHAYNQEIPGEDGFLPEGVLTEIRLPDPLPGMAIASGALIARLRLLGSTDQWIINQAGIYQRAVGELLTVFGRVDLPEFLVGEAVTELNLLSETLLNLFTGGIKLHITTDGANQITFEGYFDSSCGPQRACIYQKLRQSYSPVVNRTTLASCQIYIKAIIGQNSRGRAIAGPDQELRCGLRLPGIVGDDLWTVSIDSGAGLRGNDRPRNIYPLSAAIYEAKTHPESGLSYDQLDPTYHYQDPHSRVDDLEQGRERFLDFNHLLNQVFHQISR